MNNGNIVSVDGKYPLAALSRTVTNNITPADPIGDALRADATAYWKMDENSGTRTDATGRGNDLSSGNFTGSTAGKINNAADFVAANTNYLSKTSNADLQVHDSDFSFSFWCKYTGTFDVNSPPGDLISKSSEYDISVQYLTRDLVFTFFIQDVDYGVPAVTNTILDYVIGEWLYIEAYVDQTNLTINLNINNGTPNSVPILGGGDTAENDLFTLGVLGYSFPTLNYPLQGAMDEILLIKRLLTNDERAYLYNSGAGRTLYP